MVWFYIYILYVYIFVITRERVCTHTYIHTHIYIVFFFKFFSIVGYYKILNIVPFAVSVVVYLFYIFNVYLLIPNS